MFEALSGCPSQDLPHAIRWYNHIASFGAEKATFPGSKKDLDSYGAGPVTNGTAKKDDDDDFDLFGSDSEEVNLFNNILLLIVSPCHLGRLGWKKPHLKGHCHA